MSNDGLITLSNLKIGDSVSYAVFYRLDDDLVIELIRGTLPFWLVSDEFLAEVTCGTNGLFSVSEDGFSLLGEINFEKTQTDIPLESASLFICLTPNLLDSCILAIDYFKEE